jgi:RND family efflux transporter MFP subunit
MDCSLRSKLSASPFTPWIGPGVLAFALAACGEAPKPPERMPLPVITQTVAIGPQFSSVSLTGEIRARVQSDLSFRTAGRIASRTAEIGDRVEAGQVLATLETTEQTADVNAATAGVQAAEATLRQVSATFQRQQTLMASGFTTQTNFESASQGLAAAQAALVSAKASLATAQEQLGYTSLRADASGVITARNAEAGQVVEAAQAVFTVARDGARDAVFDIYETLLTKPPTEEAIAITLLSNPAIKTSGKVREISPTIDPTTGTVRIKISIADPPPEMGLGAAVTGVGRFQTQDIAVLPWTAFFVQGDKPAVWVVDQNSKMVSLRPITVASYRSGELLVRDGLKSGDIVVIGGVQLLRPDQTVSPQPVSSQAGAPQ